MNQKIREVKQKLMRMENELSYTNLETLKEELAKVEEKIRTEEMQINPSKVRIIERF